MSQAAILKFPGDAAPKEEGSRKLFLSFLVLALAATATFYWWYQHNQLLTAIVPVPATVAPAVVKEAPAPAPVVEPVAPARVVPVPVVAPALVPKPVILTAEQKRLKVAQDGFDNVLFMAGQHPDAYGFSSDEFVGQAKLGKEIPVYTIKLQGRDKFAKQPVTSLLQPVEAWLYPVTLNNHVRYMVQVRYDGHAYVLGEGSRALGASYDKILAQWPADQGFHPQLITVRNLPAWYFSVPELPDQNITDTDRMLDLTPALSPATIVLANCQ